MKLLFDQMLSPKLVAPRGRLSRQRNGPNEPVAISLLDRRDALERFEASTTQGVFILE